MKQNFLTVLILTLSLILGLGNLQAFEDNTIVPINMPYPMSANSDGSIVVGYAGNNEGAYYWTEEDGVVLLDLGSAEKISDNGLIVGTRVSQNETSSVAEAGYWDLEGNFTSLGNFPGTEPTSDGNYSDALAISSDGTVIGGMGWISAWGVNAFKWTSTGGMVNLRDSDESSRVYAMSSDGNLLAGWIEEDYMRNAVYWDQADSLHYIPGLGNGEATCVSPNGQYIGGYSADQAFVYDGSGVSLVGTVGIGWSTTIAYVNSSGLAVGVERNFFEGHQAAIVYTEEMGLLSAVDYFIMNGVDIAEDYFIAGLSWVSEDSKTFVGFGAGDNDGFIIRLSDSATISGNISAGATADLTQARVSNGIEFTNPDSEGNYTLAVSPGTHVLTVSLPGHYTEESEEITVIEGQIITDINFTLEEIENIATIAGNISLNSGTGSLSQVEISAGDFSTQADENGFYELILSAGDYELVAELDGYVPYTEEISITENQEMDLDIELLHLDTPTHLQVNIYGEGIDFDNTRVFVNHTSLDVENYITPGIEGTIDLELAYEENLSVSIYSPGFEPALRSGITLTPYQPIVIEFVLQNLYHAPRNLTYTESNDLVWDAPYVLNSYVDDFESYPTGSAISLSNPIWIPLYTTAGGSGDPTVISYPDFSDGNILEIADDNDAIVDVGNILDPSSTISNGVYEINFDLLVPEGNAGHYNIIRSFDDLEFSLEVFLRQDGTLQIHHSNDVINTYTYNHDEWLEFSHIIDLMNDSASLNINGEEIAVWQYSAHAYDDGYGQNRLDLINFSAESEPTSTETCYFFIDNFAFSEVDGLGADGYLVYRDDVLITPTPLADMTFSDVTLEEGTYLYAVTALYDNEESVPVTITVDIEPTSNDDNNVAFTTSLKANYPNPFNPETTINFSLASEEFVRIDIFNLKGQKVKNLANRKFDKGNHGLVWNGLDSRGKQVISGIYFYRMKVGNYTSTRKMTLMK